ncbi:3435_t:CDS:10 [Paraglomus brasilianum]|uniref:Exocyst complex component Sec8 n=1 Tax=Paraglomus brasilianum TaxID=144538 RepID=A0A9N9AFB5_9GLOM|nr:3435_t:CDS:10 [Paraglomus brasilianum]
MAYYVSDVMYVEDTRAANEDSLREMEGKLNGRDVMRMISNQWDFMLDADFNPVKLALALLDDSSLGKDYGAFQRTMDTLNKALGLIVNDYYQGFNSSIGTFGGVIMNIEDSQERVCEIKNQLKQCKQSLLSKRADLMQLWFRSQQYKEMIRILDLIEEVKGTPEKLEVLIREKHFLTAAKTLLEAIRTMDRREMAGIGALSDLKRYLKAQQNSFHEVLIEQLHNHLYLKSPYCDSRWVRYSKDQASLPAAIFDLNSEKEIRSVSNHADGIGSKSQSLSVNTSISINSSLVPRSPRSPMLTSSPKPISPALPKSTSPALNSSGDDEEAIKENLDINPESDSFYYMEIILESLALIGKLPLALETISQNLPIEIYQLVDKTIAEVEERRTVDVFATMNTKKTDHMNRYFFDSPKNETQMEILRDLLWTLYSKLDAVLQGHRFILNVVERISRRPSYLKNINGTQKIRVYSFIEIWKPIQSELRALLRDYITDDEREKDIFATPSATMNDLIKEKKPRDRSKQLFKFSDTDQTTTIVLDKQYNEDITKVLQKSLPDIFGKTNGDRIVLSGLVVDKFANTNMTVGHRLVVRPDPFNVSVLFEPTMVFLNNVKNIVSSSGDAGTVDFSVFLDDFVFNVFLPQIEDKVMELFDQATNDPRAFQEDAKYKRFAPLPIVKSASSLMMLIESLCSMLRTMSFHKDEYGRMIVRILTKYYVNCFEQYQAIVSKNSLKDDSSDSRNQQKISATWVQQDQLADVFAQYPYLADDAVKNKRRRAELCKKEIKTLMRFKKNRIIRTGELIVDGNKIKSVAILYHSLKWFVAKIWQLRGLAYENVARMDDGKLAKSNRRWSSYDALNMANGVAVKEKEKAKNEEEVMLPLTGEMATRFDALLATFQQLAEQCLFTLRVEMRCHTMHYIDLATREGNYQLMEEAVEPDPYIIQLNEDLVKCDDYLSSSLPSREHKFIFEGLDKLMEKLLINNVTFMKNLNPNGANKMLRNILALQQNLKNIVDNPKEISLDRAKRYYELYKHGPGDMLASVRNNKNSRDNKPEFTFEEYQAMLEVIYNIDNAKEPDTAGRLDGGPSQNRRLFNEHLLELNELMLDFL